MEKIYYIETTLNGYITKKIPICNYDKNKDYCCDLEFEKNNEKYEYYDEFSGDWEELDKFLKNGTTLGLENYQTEQDKYFSTNKNIYLEFYNTFLTGYYYDEGIITGIMIK